LLFVWKNALAVPSLLAWELGFGNPLAYPLASCTIGCDSMAVTIAVPRHVAAATTMANMVIVFLLIVSVDVMQCIALLKYADKCDVILLLVIVTYVCY
jgi:hypothetical protein